MKKNYLLGLLLLLTFNVFAQFETYESDEFTVKYPNTWELNTSGIRGTKIFVSSPLSSETDKFQENVNVLTQNLKGMNIDLDNFVSLSKTQLSNLPKAKILESKRLKKNGLEYHEILVDAFVNNLDLKFLQHYYIIDEVAYVVTYTQEKLDKDGYFNTGKKILKSFVIKQ